MTTDTITVSDARSGKVIRTFSAPGVAFIGMLRWSPDGKWLAASGWSGGRGVLILVTPEGNVASSALNMASDVFAWNSRGTALYVAKSAGSGSDVVKVAIDRKSGGQAGPAVTLLSGLPNVTALDLSPNGPALVMSRGGISSHVWTATLDGSASSAELRQATTGTRLSFSPAVSPDGRWLAWIEKDGSARSVLVAPFEGGSTRLLARYDRERVEYPVWAPDSRNLGFVVTDSGRSRIMMTDVEGKQPTPLVTVARGWGPCWAWGPGVIVAWSGADSDFVVVDLKSGARRTLRMPDLGFGMYGPAISADGKEMIATEWRAFGEWNRLYTISLAGGSWTRVKYDIPGDPTPIRWDASGIYLDVTTTLTAQSRPARVFRAERPGQTFKPFLKPLQQCSSSSEAALSLSNDHRRAACTESRDLPDVWLVTDFDPDAH